MSKGFQCNFSTELWWAPTKGKISNLGFDVQINILARKLLHRVKTMDMGQVLRQVSVRMKGDSLCIILNHLTDLNKLCAKSCRLVHCCAPKPGFKNLPQERFKLV